MIETMVVGGGGTPDVAGVLRRVLQAVETGEPIVCCLAGNMEDPEVQRLIRAAEILNKAEQDIKALVTDSDDGDDSYDDDDEQQGRDDRPGDEESGQGWREWPPVEDEESDEEHADKAYSGLAGTENSPVQESDSVE